MKSVNTRDKFDKKFNQKGYNEDDHEGSVHDYFYDQSYGQFDLTFDVFGPIKVSQNYAYYGENDKNSNDKYVGILAAEACRLANQNYDINWADYDWDGDKEVDQVFIIYAGYGEHAGASKNAIWPHESSLTLAKRSGDGEGAIRLGGQIIDTYAMSCELRGTSGSKMDGIGAACHEFTHCLGLPDFYDVKYTGGFGMQHWDIMASGNNNGPMGHGEIPAGFTAYERWFAGWLNLIELDESTTITDMPCLNDEPVAYIIYNEGNHNEYFILENRQPTGWHQYVNYYTGMHGLLVTHVDYYRDIWVTNTVNSVKKHQRMSIIPAGNNYGTFTGSTYSVTADQYRSHLFPGNRYVTELTNESHASCGGELFNRNIGGTKYMNKPITDIRESNGLISFQFMGGSEAMDIKDLYIRWCSDRATYTTRHLYREEKWHNQENLVNALIFGTSILNLSILLIPVGIHDVVFRYADVQFLGLFWIHLLDELGRHPTPHFTITHLRTFQHQGTCSNNGTFAYDGIIEHRRTHPNQCPTFHDATMQGHIVSDGHIIPNLYGCLFI